MELLKGAILIEIGWSCTVKVVESVSAPRLAVTPDAPLPTPVAVPCDPNALLIVATVVDEEAHVVFVVMFALVPSV